MTPGGSLPPMAVAKAQASGVAVIAFTRRKPVRGPLPDHLPRHRIVVPAPEDCPCCSGADLKKIGETQTDSLEVVPRQWIVLERDCQDFRVWAGG